MNIQRYKIADMAHLHPDKDGDICLHIDADYEGSRLCRIIKDKDDAIETLQNKTSRLNERLVVQKQVIDTKDKTIAEQAKEIERLRAGLVECGECVKYTGSYESVTALVRELTK